MTPAAIAALRVSVVVDDQAPGTLTALLARLERFWRESQAERDRAGRALPELKEGRAA